MYRQNDPTRYERYQGLTGDGVWNGIRGLLICLLYGAVCGGILGGTVGGAIGLAFFLIGIFYGLPIGLIVGAVAGAVCGFSGSFFGGRWGWTFGSALGMFAVILIPMIGSVSDRGIETGLSFLLLGASLLAGFVGYLLYTWVARGEPRNGEFFHSWQRNLIAVGYFRTTFMERFVAGMMLLSFAGILCLIFINVR